jgi:acetoin utilization protein AcuB
MLIAQRMSRRVIAVRPLESIRRARALMTEQRINQLLVIENDRLLGIITDRDVRGASPSVFDCSLYDTPEPHAIADPSTIPVERVMTRDVVTAAPEETIFAAARLMRSRRIGAVPVVAGNRVVGIVTRSDLLDALLEFDIAAPG